MMIEMPPNVRPQYAFAAFSGFDRRKTLPRSLVRWFSSSAVQVVPS